MAEEMMDLLLNEQECYQATIAYAHRLGRKVSRGTHAGDRALCEAQLAKDEARFQELLKQKDQECKDIRSIEWFNQENQKRKEIEQAKRKERERIIGKVDKMLTQLIAQRFLPPEYQSFLEYRWQTLKKGE